VYPVRRHLIALRPIICIMTHPRPIPTDVYRYKVMYILIPIPIDHLGAPHRDEHRARYALAMRDLLASDGGRRRSVARQDAAIRAMLSSGGTRTQQQQQRMVYR
jgi:hypothetical protein